MFEHLRLEFCLALERGLRHLYCCTAYLRRNTSSVRLSLKADKGALLRTPYKKPLTDISVSLNHYCCSSQAAFRLSARAVPWP